MGKHTFFHEQKWGWTPPKKNTKSINVRGKITKNNKPYLIGNCDLCNKLKSKFLNIKQIKGNGILGNLFKNIPILNTIF